VVCSKGQGGDGKKKEKGESCPMWVGKKKEGPTVCPNAKKKPNLPHSVSPTNESLMGLGEKKDQAAAIRTGGQEKGRASGISEGEKGS